MTSEEFIAESPQDIKGENAGKRSVLINGKKKNRETGEYEEYPKPRFEKYLASDFSRLSEARLSFSFVRTKHYLVTAA